MSRTPPSPTLRALVAALCATALLAGATACSEGDDDERSSATSTPATASTGPGDDAPSPSPDDEGTPATTGAITATGDDAAWCESLIDFDEGADAVDPTDAGAVTRFEEALQRLADEAPEAIADDMAVVADATSTLIDAGATGTIDPALEAEADASFARITTWAQENCGYDLEG